MQMYNMQAFIQVYYQYHQHTFLCIVSYTDGDIDIDSEKMIIIAFFILVAVSYLC